MFYTWFTIITHDMRRQKERGGPDPPLALPPRHEYAHSKYTGNAAVGRLIADADISSINYSIDVVNGTVFLTGIARSTEEMGRVIDHARSLRFATEVINYIRVSEEDRQ